VRGTLFVTACVTPARLLNCRFAVWRDAPPGGHLSSGSTKLPTTMAPIICPVTEHSEPYAAGSLPCSPPPYHRPGRREVFSGALPKCNKLPIFLV
jgi:hypothetical protein